MNTRLRFLAGLAVAAAAFATVPAQAHSDLSIGVTLGGPAYYAPPPPRYYEHEVVYEEPAPVYYEPRVVYEREYCPPRRYYHGRYVEERVYYRHRHHHRDWDD